MQDITDRRHREQQLARDASHDVLTGLPNRGTLTTRLQLAIGDAADTGRL